MAPIIKVNQYESRLITASEQEQQGTYRVTLECVEQSGLSATVAWLKSIRLSKLLEQMQAIDFRKENALNELEALTQSVDELISSNRGGDTAIHGFIGERAQVFLSNAWSIINGETKSCELIDDNGMTDYFERGISIQQKACKSNGWLGVDHVLRHREKYPEFHGKYQIPKDFYETYVKIGNMSQSAADRLSRHERNLWNKIQKVKQAGIVVEPMKVTYSEIQPDRIYDTIDNQRKELLSEAEKQNEFAVEAHKPTAKACIQTAVISSVAEGFLSGSAKVLEKRVSGKRFRDFDKDDAKDIGRATAEGTVKGAVRGIAVYLTENFTPIPGVVAGGAVTVAFESGKAIKKYADGHISEQECAKAIGKSAITASAGALGAKLGREICPIPIIGEVVGGFLFAFFANKGFNLIKVSQNSVLYLSDYASFI